MKELEVCLTMASVLNFSPNVKSAKKMLSLLLPIWIVVTKRSKSLKAILSRSSVMVKEWETLLFIAPLRNFTLDLAQLLNAHAEDNDLRLN